MVCVRCQKDFVDTQLFPKLLVSMDERVAKRLADEKGKDMLCLPCWLEETKGLDKNDLATVILGLLRRLEEASKQSLTSPSIPIPYPQSPTVCPPAYPWTITYTDSTTTTTLPNQSATVWSLGGYSGKVFSSISTAH